MLTDFATGPPLLRTRPALSNSAVNHCQARAQFKHGSCQILERVPVMDRTSARKRKAAATGKGHRREILGRSLLRVARNLGPVVNPYKPYRCSKEHLKGALEGCRREHVRAGVQPPSVARWRQGLRLHPGPNGKGRRGIPRRPLIVWISVASDQKAIRAPALMTSKSSKLLLPAARPTAVQAAAPPVQLRSSTS